MQNSKESGKARTGIWGLDDVLAGGLSRGSIFLLEGQPGSGKTTLVSALGGSRAPYSIEELLAAAAVAQPTAPVAG
jgi:predicted ATP-dependent serine protease